ncbi:MAG TPA: ABC transporter permease [Vicinamibacterales bacterium]|nr:ABC transporter permease [Vicinamibacterales bacterium]
MRLRHAVRSLIKSPGYTSACIAVLALGIGANSAIFSLVYDAVLKPLPFPDADRLVLLYGGFPNLPPPAATHIPVSRLTFQEWQKQATSFEHLAAFHEMQFREPGTDRPRVLQTDLVSTNFLPLVGARASIGRLFRDDEETPGSDLVVVLSDRYFEQRFDRNPDAIGKTISFGGTTYTVIGALPPDFALPATMNGENQGRPDVFIPLSRGWTRPEMDRMNVLHVAAKLKPAVTLAQARQELQSISARLSDSDLDRFPLKEAYVYTFQSEYHSDDLSRALFLLLGAVGLVLLTGCANLANLTLARAARRTREIAVRRALGASRADIIRQLLTESLILSAAGALVGLVVGHWVTKGLLTFAPSGALRPGMGELSLPVFAFAALVAVFTVLLFGLAPAISVSSIDLNTMLKSGGRGGSAAGQRSRRFLIAAEIAIALVLVTGAGLLLRSFANVIAIDLGFETDRVVSVDLDLTAAEYPDADARARLLDTTLEKVRAMPGVSAAALSDTLPMHRVSLTRFEIAGHPPLPPGEYLTADYATITPGYLEILGVPMVAGRALTAADVATNRSASEGVVLVNRAFADKYLPGVDPLGKRLIVNKKPSTIVGIVANFRALGAEEDVRPQYFTTDLRGEFAVLVLKSQVALDTLTDNLRTTLASIDERLSTAHVQTLRDYVDDFVEVRWFGLVLVGVFAGLALLLAMVGVHSVLANLVASRTREIGIRMALGATPGGIGRLVAAQTLPPLLAGVAVGLVLSAALGVVIKSMLFQIASYDPLTFGLAIAALLASAPLAMWWPVRRATRVECTVALRED